MMMMTNVCRICGLNSNGYHFGVKSCRACAAFFRRCANSKWGYKKCQRKSENWEICACRPCRLRRCIAMGMETKRFQFNRDRNVEKLPSILTPTVSIFTGHPEFLMFHDSTSPSSKVFIDVRNLISEASRRLDYGCELPIIADNQLKKLSLGFKFLRFRSGKKKLYGEFGRAEFVDMIEFYFITVIKWIMLFDEFQKVKRSCQMTILYSIWHVWMKFHKCFCTATYRKVNQNAKPAQKIVRNIVMDNEKSQIDTVWMSDYPKEYVEMYIQSQVIHESEIIESLIKLNLTDVELTYMFAQACFEYTGNKFRGEIQKVTDHFQQILSNDLHNYYIDELKIPRYSHRLTNMMKVNNLVQKSIWESRPRRELNKVFNMVRIGFSHPEMFEDSQFD